MKIITKKERLYYVLEPRDAGIVKICLDYCYHRLSKHSDTGISEVVDLGALDALRLQFPLIKS